MNKFNVLLIDDNPSGSILSGNDYIPKISFSDTYAEGLEQYFHLEYLQSLTDIKEFRFYSKNILNSQSKFKSNNLSFIPDAILFDYNFKVQDELENKESIEELLNCKIASRIGYNTYRRPYNKNLSDSGIEKWYKIVNDNAFGCFAGAILVNDFIDNACIGLPTTAFSENAFHGKEEIEYFEDLLKSDFGKSFSKKGRIDPLWIELISDIMILKQERIIQLIKEGKISVDLNNLISLLNGGWFNLTDGVIKEQYFKFSTSYGYKSIHLSALFINKDTNLSECVPEDLVVISKDKSITNRDVEIWKFINSISQAVVDVVKLGLEVSEFVLSKNIAETVYNEYLSSFEDRIDLSEYSFRKEVLDTREMVRYIELKSELYFSVVNDKIAKEKEVSILNYKDLYDPGIIRLAIIYIVTYASIELSRLSKRSGGKDEYRELDEQEIYYLLNPIVNTSRSNNLILPIHFENYTKIRGILSDFGTTGTRIWEKTHPITKASSFFDFSSWISPGEKLIIKSFFNCDENLYPSFIK